MAEMWKPQSNDVYKGWWDAIMTEASDDLNDFETHFLTSVSMRLDTGYALSQAMAEKLEQIYVQHTK